MLYASRKSGISAGADDVAAIPAGDSYTIRAADDTVYLLATAAGDVQLESIGVTEVFRIAAARSSSGGGEGGTVDEVARQAIASHANNEDIHLTAEKAIGAAATAISNPNLLDNPDFKINQRGLSEYTYTSNTGYAADRWNIARLLSVSTPMGKMQLTENGVNLVSADSVNDIFLRQFIANGEQLVGKNVTISLNVDEFTGEWAVGQYGKAAHTLPPINGNSTISITFEWAENDGYGIQLFNRTAGATLNGLKWVKLELGSVATPFTPPDPATELAKCQRYLSNIRANNPHRADEITANEIHFSVPVASSMFTGTPSIVDPSYLQIRKMDGTVVDGFTFRCWYTKADGEIVISAYKTSHGLTDGILVSHGYDTLLSREL